MLVPVWIDEWQQECCGDAFAFGDEVGWTLTPGHEDWLRSVLGDAYPDWSVDARVETLAEPDAAGRPGWSVLRRGRLAVSVTQPAASRLAGLLAEEHHGGLPDDAPETRGTVHRIRTVHCRHTRVSEARGPVLVPVTGTATLTEILEVPAGVIDPEGGEPGQRFVGYLVDLDVDTG